MTLKKKNSEIPQIVTEKYTLKKYSKIALNFRHTITPSISKISQNFFLTSSTQPELSNGTNPKEISKYLRPLAAKR